MSVDKPMFGRAPVAMTPHVFNAALNVALWVPIFAAFAVEYVTRSQWALLLIVLCWPAMALVRRLDEYLTQVKLAYDVADTEAELLADLAYGPKPKPSPREPSPNWARPVKAKRQ